MTDATAIRWVALGFTISGLCLVAATILELLAIINGPPWHIWWIIGLWAVGLVAGGLAWKASR